jgi:phage terminase large subunit GpA-like protein
MAQPLAIGLLMAISDRETHTVAAMLGTQICKTEIEICTAFYYIVVDPCEQLWIHATQDFAAMFSKGRFRRNVDATPAVRERVVRAKYRDDQSSTIMHYEYRGGTLDFGGPNPTDLTGRPVRVVLLDEIDKFPASAAQNFGDPVRLAIERASTFMAQGRGKVILTCSPTTLGISRIGKAYNSSDRRKLYVTCPHCQHDQTLSWASVHMDKDEQGKPNPKSARIRCEECGVIWSEGDRIAALNALKDAPGWGWRQTREFYCCDEQQTPQQWDDAGRSICHTCGARSAYDGIAGFNASKLYSKRHRLSDIARQFLEAKGDEEQMKVFTNEALAELWEPKFTHQFSTNKLMARAEVYGPQDLPKDVKVVMCGVDTHPDRLETQCVGFGYDEECWPFLYRIIRGSPVDMGPNGPWAELDRLRAMTFRVRGSDRIFRIHCTGIDMGGANTAQVLAYCNQRRGSEVGLVYATRGQGGPIPIWPPRSSLSKARRRETFFNIGVDSAKSLIYARLEMEPPEPGFRKPGYIHFPIDENFNEEYFNQLAAERQIKAKRSGQDVLIWDKIRERNEALDTLVIALAVRRRWGRLVGSDPHSEAEPLPQSIQPAPSPKKSAPDDDRMSAMEYYNQQAERDLARQEKVAAENRARTAAEKRRGATAAEQLETLLQEHPELRENPEMKELLRQIDEADDE